MQGLGLRGVRAAAYAPARLVPGRCLGAGARVSGYVRVYMRTCQPAFHALPVLRVGCEPVWPILGWLVLGVPAKYVAASCIPCSAGSFHRWIPMVVLECPAVQLFKLSE